MPPKSPPTDREHPSLAPTDLGEWQRTLHAAVTRPLGPGDRARRRWFDGTSSARAVARLVKRSRTLSPLERVEIYNRMYWFRLLDCLAQDFPGLRALLGDRRFWRLAEAYLAASPSRSFTLRNLGARLPAFIRAHPALVRPLQAAAWDVARFEWAQVVAFDGAALPTPGAGALAAAAPGSLHLRLQPYISVLRLVHPVDHYIIALKHDELLRAQSSNAAAPQASRERTAVRLDRGGPLHLVVHRLDNQLYYKRVAPEAARLLRALRTAGPLERAFAAAFGSGRSVPDPETIRQWFETWGRLGWLGEIRPEQP